MQIDRLIKAVFEREVERNYSVMPPLPRSNQIDLEKRTIAIIENRRSHIIEIGLAACFIIVFGISIFLKDGVFRSSLVNQGVSIAQLFPENPKAAFYEFVLAINSSF
jgi:hypothetical protein